VAPAVAPVVAPSPAPGPGGDESNRNILKEIYKKIADFYPIIDNNFKIVRDTSKTKKERTDAYDLIVINKDLAIKYLADANQAYNNIANKTENDTNTIDMERLRVDDIIATLNKEQSILATLTGGGPTTKGGKRKTLNKKGRKSRTNIIVISNKTKKRK
jgi:hypothetical protein